MIKGSRQNRRFTQTLGMRSCKNTLKRYCKELWSDLVKAKDNNICVMCGTKNVKLHSHHLIPKKVCKYRYDLNCGIALCPNCHLHSLKCSPHLVPWEFEKLLIKRSPDHYNWWIKHRKNIIYNNYYLNYNKIFETLKHEYDTKYYIPVTSSKYKLWNESQNLIVINEYNKGASLRQLEIKYKVSRTRLRSILMRHNIRIRSEQKRGMTVTWRNNIIKTCGCPVQQISKNGVIITTYPSEQAALRSLGYKSRTAINNCIKGRSKTCGGYYWKLLTKGTKGTKK